MEGFNFMWFSCLCQGNLNIEKDTEPHLRARRETETRGWATSKTGSERRFLDNIQSTVSRRVDCCSGQWLTNAPMGKNGNLEQAHMGLGGIVTKVTKAVLGAHWQVCEMVGLSSWNQNRDSVQVESVYITYCGITNHPRYSGLKQLWLSHTA